MKVLRTRSLSVLWAVAALPVVAQNGWNDPLPENVNGATSPVSDVHHNSGGRRIVRVGRVAVLLAPQSGGEHTWRKTDGDTAWARIDVDGGYSGCLATGRDSTVYHFYAGRNGAQVTSVYMVKFRYDGTPPAPVAIHSPNAPSRVLNTFREYHAVNAIVDSSGDLFVATHWGDPDRIWLLRSQDGGSTWSAPLRVSDEDSLPWFYMHLEVDAANRLFCTYHEWQAFRMRCARSPDGGDSWVTRPIPGNGADVEYHNPALLTLGRDTLFVFAQKQDAGLCFNRSNDGGAAWGGWRSIEGTAGYADPSAGLADNGDLYVAYRSDGNRAPGDYRSKIVRSSDLGATWGAVDSFYQAATLVSTRSQIRYQTWWNYGGPLEWIWVQRDAPGGEGGSAHYDINNRVSIRNLTANGGPTALKNTGRGKSIRLRPGTFAPFQANGRKLE